MGSKHTSFDLFQQVTRSSIDEINILEHMVFN